MRALTPALLASAGSFWAPGRAIVITRVDGTVIRLAEMMTAQTFGGNVYQPGGNVVVGSIPLALNEEETSVDFDVFGEVGGLIEYADVMDGLYRGASVSIYCINRLAPTDGLGLLFSGKIGPVQAKSGGRVTMQVTGPLGEAGIELGHKFSPTCRWIFGDAGCKYPIETKKVVGTVSAPGSGHSLSITGFNHAHPDYNPRGGFFEVQSGRMKGFRFEFARPGFSAFLYLPVGHLFDAGDVLWIYPDCTYQPDTTGCVYWQNIVNFGGEPYMFGGNSLTGGINNFGMSGPAADDTGSGPEVTFGDDLTHSPEEDEYAWFSDLAIATSEYVVPAMTDSQANAATEATLTHVSTRAIDTGQPGGKFRMVVYDASNNLVGYTGIYTFDGTEPTFAESLTSGGGKLVKLALTTPATIDIGATYKVGHIADHLRIPPPPGDTTPPGFASLLIRRPSGTNLYRQTDPYVIASLDDPIPTTLPAETLDPDDTGPWLKLVLRLHATPVEVA